LNNNYSAIEAQQIIENRWIDIINDQYTELKYIQKRHSHSFINKIHEAKETLNTLTEVGVIKRKFPTVSPYLNDLNLLLLTYGIAVNGVLMNIGYTNLCSIIGNKVIHYIFMVNIIKRENNKKDLSSIEFFQYINLSFKEFLSEIEFSDKDIIILGDFY